MTNAVAEYVQKNWHL